MSGGECSIWLQTQEIPTADSIEKEVGRFEASDLWEKDLDNDITNKLFYIYQHYILNVSKMRLLLMNHVTINVIIVCIVVVNNCQRSWYKLIMGLIFQYWTQYFLNKSMWWVTFNLWNYIISTDVLYLTLDFYEPASDPVCFLIKPYHQILNT